MIVLLRPNSNGSEVRRRSDRTEASFAPPERAQARLLAATHRDRPSVPRRSCLRHDDLHVVTTAALTSASRHVSSAISGTLFTRLRCASTTQLHRRAKVFSRMNVRQRFVGQMATVCSRSAHGSTTA